jgi:hypothetical protein
MYERMLFSLAIETFISSPALIREGKDWLKECFPDLEINGCSNRNIGLYIEQACDGGISEFVHVHRMLID